eukprot:90119_1
MKRVFPTPTEQLEWRKTWRESKVYLTSTEHKEGIFLQTRDVVPVEESLPVPTVFMKNVRYAMTAMNPFATLTDPQTNAEQNARILEDLTAMDPKPQSILA